MMELILSLCIRAALSAGLAWSYGCGDDTAISGPSSFEDMCLLDRILVRCTLKGCCRFYFILFILLSNISDSILCGYIL